MDVELLTDIIEEKGFYVKITKESYGTNVLLEQSTPLGEDWCMEFTCADDCGDLLRQLEKCIEEFDPEEEAAPLIDNRGNNGIPTSIRALLEDADWKYDVLQDLLLTINKNRNN